jgi:hypothetical protein
VKNFITIWYADDESSPAELLGERLARITRVPLLAEGLWRDDIVLLTHRPGDGGGWPRIARVVHQRYDEVCAVDFHEPGQAKVLSALLSILGAETAVIIDPADREPGRLAVAYDWPLNPPQLAEAVGVAQGSTSVGEIETVHLHDGEAPPADPGAEDHDPAPEDEPPSTPRKSR